MDFDFIIQNIPLYKEALIVTLELGFIGIILSLIIGFICSIIQHYEISVLKTIVYWYVELSRNTPLLIQLFFLYYGLTKLGLALSGFTCGVIGLAFLGGSYMAEAFRGGFEAISKSQIESAISIGLSKVQIIRYIILPQAISIAVPSIGANCIFILKETSIISVIAVADLMFVAKDLIGMYYKTSEALTMVVIAYLIILLPMSLFFRWLERRIRYAEFGGN